MVSQVPTALSQSRGEGSCGGCREGVKEAEVPGCFLQRDLAGTLRVTWQLHFLSHIILALISVLEVKV